MADLIRHLILGSVNQHRMRSRGKPGMTGNHFFGQSLHFYHKVLPYGSVISRSL